MKRLLLLAMLLMFALGGAQAALAASFVFGPSGFDDQYDLKTNLETLVGSGTKVQETFINPSNVGPYLKLLGVSNGAVSANFAIYDAGNNMVTSAAGAAADWASDLSGNLADYKIMFDGAPAEGLSLAAAFKVAYFVGEDIVYQPTGQDAITIEAGTFFLGLSIPGYDNGGIDFVLAFSDMPFAPAVPVPAAVWLMGTGLAGLAALRRRVN